MLLAHLACYFEGTGWEGSGVEQGSVPGGCYGTGRLDSQCPVLVLGLLSAVPTMAPREAIPAWPAGPRHAALQPH